MIKLYRGEEEVTERFKSKDLFRIPEGELLIDCMLGIGDEQLEEQIDCGRPPSFNVLGSHLTGVIDEVAVLNINCPCLIGVMSNCCCLFKGVR